MVWERKDSEFANDYYYETRVGLANVYFSGNDITCCLMNGYAISFHVFYFPDLTGIRWINFIYGDTRFSALDLTADLTYDPLFFNPQL